MPYKTTPVNVRVTVKVGHADCSHTDLALTYPRYALNQCFAPHDEARDQRFLLETS